MKEKDIKDFVQSEEFIKGFISFQTAATGFVILAKLLKEVEKERNEKK